MWDTAQGDRPIHTLGHGGKDIFQPSVNEQCTDFEVDSLDNPIHDLPREIATPGSNLRPGAKQLIAFILGRQMAKSKPGIFGGPGGMHLSGTSYQSRAAFLRELFRRTSRNC